MITIQKILINIKMERDAAVQQGVQLIVSVHVRECVKVLVSVLVHMHARNYVMTTAPGYVRPIAVMVVITVVKMDVQDVREHANRIVQVKLIE